MTKHDVYRHGKIHVLRTRCSSCIFRGGNPMHLNSGRVKGMVAEAIEGQSTIVCHQTLDTLNAACRGFVDRYGAQIMTWRLAYSMGVVVEVDPPVQKGNK